MRRGGDEKNEIKIGVSNGTEELGLLGGKLETDSPSHHRSRTKKSKTTEHRRGRGAPPTWACSHSHVYSIALSAGAILSFYILRR